MAKRIVFLQKTCSQKQLKMPLDYNQVEVGGTYRKGEQKILVLNKHQVDTSSGIENRYVYKVEGELIPEYSVPYQSNELEPLITT